jgi:peroxiredoxin Q/BCP
VIEAGDRIPAVRAATCDGGVLDMGSFAGRGVLFFCPRAFTSACTREAIEFNGLLDQFATLDIAVIGVGSDTREDSQAFARQHGLRMTLVCDTDRRLSEAFGVDEEPEGAASGTTFLLGEGVVQQVWTDVDPGGHASAVLETAREIWEWPLPDVEKPF